MSEIEVITKSRLADFSLCQRLHDLKYNRGFRSLLPRELADFGTVFHGGLDRWWGAYQRGEDMMALAEGLTGMVEARLTATAVDDAQFAKAEVLLAAYDARWAPIMVDWEVVAVEKEFVATIPGRKRLRVAGKLDKIVRHRGTGLFWFVEHKTTGADLAEGSTYWQRLRMDPQVSIYHRGGDVLGYPFAGCLYDVVVRPGQKPLKATPVEQRKYTKPTKKEPVSRLYANQRAEDETLEEYRQRISDAITDNPEAFFARVEVTRLEAELAESERDVEATALQIRAGVGEHAPRNPAACFEWGRPCEFLGPCSGTESLDDPAKFAQSDDKHPELELAKL